MGKSTSRDWTQIYAIYGMDQRHTIIFLLSLALLFSILSILYLFHFNPVCAFFERLLSIAAARFATVFIGSVTVLSTLFLFFAVANFFYSDVLLHYYMAQRIVSSVSDWSSVKRALDLGCCGRGILLNAVATQLKKEGSSGRVVGLDRLKRTSLVLRTAKMEGVGEYVTCREGDTRWLPFPDDFFDVVVSGVFVHTAGKGYGHRSAEAASERMKAVGELVRVIKPGGMGVVWDLLHVPEYVRRLRELKMEGISVSERVTAFMVSSHIVSFRKPSQYIGGPSEVNLDRRL